MNESNSSIHSEMSLFKTYSYIGLNLFGIIFGTIGNLILKRPTHEKGPLNLSVF